jgi:hypothetical protein
VFLGLEKAESRLSSSFDTRIDAVDGSSIGIDPTLKFSTENILKNISSVLRVREGGIKFFL